MKDGSIHCAIYAKIYPRFINRRISDTIANRAIWNSNPVTFDQRVGVIREWLNNCCTKHEYCQPSREKLPKRFIDLRGSGQGRSPALAYSDDINASDPLFRYVALSHCWGTATPFASFRTTRVNEARHLHEISISDLPCTFQDAIRVTSALGIRYLWIDSLCIVQDDKKDWAVEAAKMAHIYRGSYLTIAATSAANGDGGLFLGSVQAGLKMQPKRAKYWHCQRGIFLPGFLRTISGSFQARYMGSAAESPCLGAPRASPFNSVGALRQRPDVLPVLFRTPV